MTADALPAMWRASFSASAEALPNTRPTEQVRQNSRTRVGHSEIPMRNEPVSSTETTSRALTPIFTMVRWATFPTSAVASELMATMPREFTPNARVYCPASSPRIFCSTKVEPEMYEKSAPNAKHMVSENPMYRRILNTFGISEYTLNAVPW